MTGFDEETAEVESLDELLSMGFMKKLAASAGFFRFSINLVKPRCSTGVVMVELKDGSFWGVGHVKGKKADLEALGLPEWEYNKK